MLPNVKEKNNSYTINTSKNTKRGNISEFILHGKHKVDKKKLRRTHFWASLVAQIVKSLPAVQETQVQFPGQEEPLEKGSIPAWRTLGTQEPGGL